MKSSMVSRYCGRSNKRSIEPFKSGKEFSLFKFVIIAVTSKEAFEELFVGCKE